MAKKTTIAELARMINEGFNETATKEDVKGLEEKMNSRFEQIDSRQDNLDARMGRIETDIHGLRGELVYRHEFDDPLAPIKYLEKKLGIESGI